MIRARSVAYAAALLGAACTAEHSPEPMPGTRAATTAPEGSTSGSTTPPASASGALSCATNLGPELAKLGVPGLSAAIVKNGKIACTAVAGVAEIETQRAVTPDTVFAWASVSKTVTAVTLMTLFDEGRFALDDDANRYLPFAVHVPNCETSTITIRHLLTHTSSIVEDTDVGPYADAYVVGDSPIALGDFLRDYLVPGGAHYDAKENFEPTCPGTKAEYSNVGAALAGYVGERIAGVSFDELAKQRVFSPLGMTQASFRLRDFDLHRLAMPYERSGGAFVPVGHTGFPTYPDGLLRSSVPALARFLLMFMNDGELEGTRILAKSTVVEMKRRQVPELDDIQGLVFYYEDFPGRPGVLGHDGSDPGVSSNMYYDPADGAGVLLVANGEWRDSAAEALMGVLFEETRRY